ncbi:MAG: FCD domain-containing protein, partial [Hyphomonas sp.]|uniref:FCD domain-containing protein n=1 Tax=Hyphomonas sp. TaxID=87 RepID=UPI0034A05C4A
QSIANGGIEWEATIIGAHHKLNSFETRMLAGEKVDIPTWKKFDREFHIAVISACDSDLIVQMHKDVFDKYLRYLALALGFRGGAAVEEHQQILNLALKRDADGAVNMLSVHIQSGVEQAISNGFQLNP